MAVKGRSAGGRSRPRKAAQRAKIKAGVRATARRKLTSLARATDNRDIAATLRDTRALGRRLGRLFRTENIAVDARLRRQRGFARFEEEARALHDAYAQKRQAAGGDPAKAERVAAAYRKDARQLMEANESLFARAYNEAVDDARVAERVLAAMALPEGFVLKRGRLGGVVMRAFDHHEDDDSINPIGRTPEPFADCLVAPFDEGAIHSDAALASFAGGGFNESGGSTASNAYALEAGGAAARALVGSFITVPPGFTRLRVSAEMRCDYLTEAISVAAVSYASADAIVELLHTDNTVLTGVENVSSALAPVGWGDRHEDIDTFFVNATFLIPSAGGEFMVRAGGRCNAWAGGYFGIGNGKIRTFRTEICVEALP